MGRLLKRIQKPKIKKKKVSFIFTEQTLKELEELQKQVGYQNKSEFVEKLLKFALEELKKELKKKRTTLKKEENQEDLTVPEVADRFSSEELS